MERVMFVRDIVRYRTWHYVPNWKNQSVVYILTFILLHIIPLLKGQSMFGLYGYIFSFIWLHCVKPFDNMGQSEHHATLTMSWHSWRHVSKDKEINNFSSIQSPWTESWSLLLLKSLVKNVRRSEGKEPFVQWFSSGQWTFRPWKSCWLCGWIKVSGTGEQWWNHIGSQPQASLTSPTNATRPPPSPLKKTTGTTSWKKPNTTKEKKRSKISIPSKERNKERFEEIIYVDSTQSISCNHLRPMKADTNTKI